MLKSIDKAVKEKMFTCFFRSASSPFSSLLLIIFQSSPIEKLGLTPFSVICHQLIVLTELKDLWKLWIWSFWMSFGWTCCSCQQMELWWTLAPLTALKLPQWLGRAPCLALWSWVYKLNTLFVFFVLFFSTQDVNSSTTDGASRLWCKWLIKPIFL